MTENCKTPGALPKHFLYFNLTMNIAGTEEDTEFDHRPPEGLNVFKLINL
jgi:hypothetical protein